VQFTGPFQELEHQFVSLSAGVWVKEAVPAMGSHVLLDLFRDLSSGTWIPAATRLPINFSW
jgi:hypothetical protein